jgi:hypothetical protein
LTRWICKRRRRCWRNSQIEQADFAFAGTDI